MPDRLLTALQDAWRQMLTTWEPRDIRARDAALTAFCDDQGCDVGVFHRAVIVRMKDKVPLPTAIAEAAAEKEKAA